MKLAGFGPKFPWLAGLVCAASVSAAELPAEPSPEVAAVSAMQPYRPAEQVRGTLRLWGHGSTKIDFMGRLVRAWEVDFNRFQPGVTFDYRMYGTASAIGALYAGAGDIALMGEEIFPFEARAYQEAMGRSPGSVEIATGSWDVRNFDFAQMFFVNRANPLGHMTLAQLDAVFGLENRRGLEPIRTWGQLGVTGEWADKPIHLYGWAYDNDFWIYLQQALFAGSHRWSNSLHEYAHIYRPDGTIYDAGQQILEALAKDPYGLALSNERYINPEVRALALSESKEGPFVAASKSSLIDRAYPLTRIIPAVFNQNPDGSVAPAVREFLRYLVSREGQAVVARDAEYLPLNPASDREQQDKLEHMPKAKPSISDASVATSGAIRVWGDERMGSLIRLWEEDYSGLHSGTLFDNKLMGTPTGVAGLYTKTADLVFLGRAINPVETMAFTWVFRYKPLGLDVATGSVELPGGAPALAAFVHPANPISQLTLAQLDAAFGREHRRGMENVNTWGDLGLTGEWATKPVHLYTYDIESGRAVFFRDLVLRGSRKWNWDSLREFQGKKEGDGSDSSADRRILEALAKDPNGLAVANLGVPGVNVKTLSLASDAAGPFFPPTRETLIQGNYPLARSVGAYLNRAPGQSVDSELKAFLNFIVSPEGQADVAKAGGYLPLPPTLLRAAQRQLE